MASVAVYFKGIADTLNLPVLVEAIDERTEKFMDGQDRVEVRITGPFMRQASENYYQAIVDVNILLTSRHSGTQTNAYAMMLNAGIFLDALEGPINVFNYGAEAGDYVASDPTSKIWLGYLMPKFNKPARLLNFGQVDASDKIFQVEVESAFLMELSE